MHQALPDIPIVGVGGIRTGLDALQFILAGASAVQVGTVIFHDPGAPARVSRELREALAARGMDRLEQAIGLGHRPPDMMVPEAPEPLGAELSPAEPESYPGYPPGYESGYDTSYEDEAMRLTEDA